MRRYVFKQDQVFRPRHPTAKWSSPDISLSGTSMLQQNTKLLCDHNLSLLDFVKMSSLKAWLLIAFVTVWRVNEEIYTSVPHLVLFPPIFSLFLHIQYCSKKFGLERLLRDHMRQHVNHYKCPLCDMTCAFPANLRHHIQYKHSEYRPHCCSQCPYMAKTQYDLIKHMNNHELEETYECDVAGCDYSSVRLVY